MNTREPIYYYATYITPRKIYFLLLVFLFIGLSATSCRKGGPEAAPAGKADAAPVEAKTAIVVKTSMPETYTAMGAVAPRGKSALSSKVMGRIIEINVREGDIVSAGRRLIVIDSSDIETQVRQAESGVLQSRQGLAEIEDAIGAAEAGVDSANANAVLARNTYERYLDLKNKKSVSQQEFDQAQAQMRMSEAAVRQAQKQRDSLKQKRAQALSMISQAGDGLSRAKIMRGYATIAAPFDGVIVQRNAEPGQLAYPGTPLITIEYNTGYRLEAPIDESRLVNVRLQDNVNVEIPSLGDETFIGRVVEVGRSIDPQSHAFLAKIALRDDPRLRSGMFGRAKFVVGKSDKIMIPSKAVIRNGSLDGVYVVDSTGAARLRVVKLAEAQPGGLVEVLSGVGAGDRIVTSNAANLFDGRKIKGY